MTVKQLIEVLSKIEDQDVKVMVKGYEGGVNDLQIGNGIGNNIPAIVNVALDVNEEWYYGAHEVQQYSHEYTDKQIIKAIVL